MSQSCSYLSDLVIEKVSVDKKKVALSFAASHATYDENATVQKDLADQLLHLIPSRNWNRVLEIGCGTGYLAEQFLRRQKVGRLYLNDLAPELCQVSCKRVAGSEVCTLPGDIETIALPNQLDLIVSSSTLQWLDDLDAVLAKCAASLVCDGLFVFSIFGMGTMAEIAALSGGGLKYLTLHELQSLVERYFSVSTVESLQDTLYFPNVMSLFRHIRYTGVGGIGKWRWTRRSMKAFEEEYRTRFGGERGLPVSYCAHCFLCRKKER